jgi:hypothetical protein
MSFVATTGARKPPVRSSLPIPSLTIQAACTHGLADGLPIERGRPQTTK